MRKLLALTFLLTVPATAQAKAPNLTDKQINQGLQAAANRLVSDGEQIYKQRGDCSRTGPRSADCGIVLKRAGEKGYAGPFSSYAPPGTCEVGVQVKRDKRGVLFIIRYAGGPHMQGACPAP